MFWNQFATNSFFYPVPKSSYQFILTSQEFVRFKAKKKKNFHKIERNNCGLCGHNTVPSPGNHVVLMRDGFARESGAVSLRCTTRKDGFPPLLLSCGPVIAATSNTIVTLRPSVFPKVQNCMDIKDNCTSCVHGHSILQIITSSHDNLAFSQQRTRTWEGVEFNV